MERLLPWRAALAVALLFAFACGKPATNDPKDPQDSGTTPEVDAGTDAGTPPPPEGPEVTSQDGYGAFLPSPTRAVIAGTNLVLIASQGMVMDPANLGGESGDGTSWDNWIRPGLTALSPDTGKVRIYTSADGLPTMHYVDPFQDYGIHTASLFDLAWIQKDQTFAAAAWDFVVKGTIAQDGSITFAGNRVKAAGQAEYAHVAHLAVSGGELFAGTDQGLVVLDPTNLSVKRWVDLGTVASGPWIEDLSAGTVDGQDAVGVVFGPAEAPASSIALVHPGEAKAQLFAPPNGEVPLSAYGMQGMMLVGAVGTDGRGLIFAIGPSLSGLAMDIMVTSDSLSASSQGAVRPGVMAWDDARQKLVVGGNLTPSGGGGLVELQGSSDGTIWGSAEDFFLSTDPFFSMQPKLVDALAFDDAGRLYLAGRQQCSEYKLMQLPTYRVERDDLGAPRLVKPYLSGIRDLQKDPVNGDTWVAWRDAQRGEACNGIPVGQGVCRIRADGSCELFPVTTSDGSLILTNPGVSSIAFGDPARKEMALATRDEATWLHKGDTARQVSTQMDPGLSLDMTKAAFGPDGTLWLASEADWRAYPDLDEDAVNARGPHGVGFLVLDDQGQTVAMRRYVRVKSDQAQGDEIGGLGSDTVYDVLPQDGAKKALVALGYERTLTVYDHIQGDVSPKNIPGGIALLDDSTITAFAAPEGAAFTDVVKLAKGKDGAVYAVDAALGVLVLDVSAHTSSVWAKAPWAAPERPLSLAADNAGHVAVGTTKALYLFGADTGVTKVLDGTAGYVWSLRFDSDGVLYAGADQGLFRFAVAGASLPEVLGPASFPTRELFPPPCGGIDGCVCKDNADCTKGYECACDLNNNCACQPQDPCTVDPTGKGCACDSSKPACGAGLICDCTFATCSCQVDPSTCANDACACKETFDCPINWYCNQGAGTCAERQACDSDCSCATATGCSPGLQCQGGIAGYSCI